MKQRQCSLITFWINRNVSINFAPILVDIVTGEQAVSSQVSSDHWLRVLALDRLNQSPTTATISGRHTPAGTGDCTRDVIRARVMT